MRIAVVTAIFGDYDNLNSAPPTEGVDFFCFTNCIKNANGWILRYDTIHHQQNSRKFYRNSTLSSSELESNMMASKFYKLQAHNVLENYDVILWVDGTFELRDVNIPDMCKKYLKENDIAVFGHGSRTSIYDEAIICANNFNNMFRTKYQNQDMLYQVYRYMEDEHVDALGLFEMGVFYRRVNKETNQLMDDWWRHNCLYTYQDQLSFPYVLKKSGLSHLMISNNVYENDLCVYRYHNKHYLPIVDSKIDKYSKTYKFNEVFVSLQATRSNSNFKEAVFSKIQKGKSIKSIDKLVASDITKLDILGKRDMIRPIMEEGDDGELGFLPTELLLLNNNNEKLARLLRYVRLSNPYTIETREYDAWVNHTQGLLAVELTKPLKQSYTGINEYGCFKIHQALHPHDDVGINFPGENVTISSPKIYIECITELTNQLEKIRDDIPIQESELSINIIETKEDMLFLDKETLMYGNIYSENQELPKHLKLLDKPDYTFAYVMVSIFGIVLFIMITTKISMMIYQWMGHHSSPVSQTPNPLSLVQ
jgi:hypothetical protein